MEAYIGWAILSVCLISLLSFLGLTFVGCKPRVLNEVLLELVSLSVGALMGDAFLHILPDVYAEISDPNVVSGLVLAGFFVGFLLEKAIGHSHSHAPDEGAHAHAHEHPHGHHDAVEHTPEECACVIVDTEPVAADGPSLSTDVTEIVPAEPAAVPVRSRKPAATTAGQGDDAAAGPRHGGHGGRHEKKRFMYVLLLGDSVHNFTDGITIAAAFAGSVSIGLATALAVALHEIPHEFGNFGALVHAGLSRRRAVLYNFLTDLFAVLGTVLTLVVAAFTTGVVSYVLPFAAGNFIYVAAADLIPELLKERRPMRTLTQLAGVGLGIGMMVLILVVEAELIDGHSSNSSSSDSSSHNIQDHMAPARLLLGA